ncbi:uncharacterized protein LOC115758264 [Drosophila novamexicana]|uniref:uncharacterized protein LOC115758264 n=1 Tax=Drosophila novamexicana TaxID=47314 RepID=UPI0011E5FD40|nr:uncharacterized protein LOC115758264 [Drosophila novamexicana]
MKLQLLALLLYLSHMCEGQTAGSCHYFSETKMDWFEALFTCQRKQMCLANIKTQRSFEEFEIKLKASYRDEYWFGLNGYEKYAFKYVSDGAPLGYMPPAAMIHLDKPCAFVKPLDKTHFTFETGNCGRPRRFICTAEPRCNGKDTNSTFFPSLSAALPCEIKKEILEKLGIKPVDNED